jgi:MATE family multidrug resistance protein
MALFIARLGTMAAASHQIASNLTGVLYMMPLSLGIATSARVSYWLGAGDEPRARLALRLGFKLMLLFALTSGSVVMLAHEQVARLYAGANPELVALAGGLLMWAAVYHCADAVQALCVFVLRSYGVAVTPLIVYGLLLWGVGLGGGYLLAYRGVAGWSPMQAPQAFWSAGAVALGLTSLIFTALLWRVVQARRHQARVPAPSAAPPETPA